MAPCMGPMSLVRAHSPWAGLCPENAGKTKKQNIIYSGIPKFMRKPSMLTVAQTMQNI